MCFTPIQAVFIFFIDFLLVNNLIKELQIMFLISSVVF